MRPFLLSLSALLLAGPGFAAPLDISKALHDQVVRCWNPPAKATGTVTVRLELKQDGTIVGTPTVNGLASAGVGRAAVHAVQFCAPYRLPPERFTDWQHASLTLSATGK